MRKWRWQSALRSKTFMQSFRTLCLTYAVLMLLMLTTITAQRVNARIEFLQQNVDRVAVAVQDELNAARASALTLASSATASHILSQHTPSLDTLMDMDDDLTASFSIRASFQSIELFLLHGDLVCLSIDGVLPISSYKDSAFVSMLAPGVLRDAWVEREYRVFDTAQSQSVVSYLCGLPLYESAKTGYIVVNLKLSALAQIASATAAAEGLSVWLNGIWIAGEPAGAAEDPETAYARVATSGGKMCCRSDATTDIQAAYCVEWVSLIRESLPSGRAIVSTLGGCFVILLALSVLLTRRILAPARSLLSRISAQMELDSLAEDEFELMDHAFRDMAARLLHSERSLKNNQPLLRERLIGELILTNDPPTRRADQLQALDIRFAHPLFAIALLSPPECDTERKLAIRNSAEEMYRTVGDVYTTYGERGAFVFLINAPLTDNLGERLSRVSASLRATILATVGEPPAFSIAVCDPKEPLLLNAYQRARQNLLPADAADDETVGAPLTGEMVYVTAVDENTALQISDSVINQDSDAAAALLERLRSAYFPDDLDLDLARKLAMQLCFHLLTTLFEREMRVSDEIVLGAVRRLGRAETPGECVDVLQSAIGSLIAPKGVITSDAMEYVTKATEYIKQNYSSALSVPLIAEMVHVNSIYLNKLFRMALDTTIAEYLSRYRVDRSLDLLADSELTIAEISVRVGFSEPRGYIRNFRKFFAVTPGEYRKGIAAE